MLGSKEGTGRGKFQVKKQVKKSDENFWKKKRKNLVTGYSVLYRATRREWKLESPVIKSISLLLETIPTFSNTYISVITNRWKETTFIYHNPSFETENYYT